MPVRQRSMSSRHSGDDRFNSLKMRLVSEWRGDSSGEKSPPEIVEEKNASDKLVHVYVIWDDWVDFDAQARSEMIVDALQEIRGAAAILDLTIAMGLSKAEASRMGLS